MTSPSQAHPPPAAVAPRLINWPVRLIVGLLAILGILAALCLILLMTGFVIGEEFSPDNFQRRHFRYLEIPFVHVQMQPIYRTYSSTSLEKYLTRKKYLGRTKGKRPDWHLVRQSGIDPASPECDARILCQYLDIDNDQGEKVWLVWTKSNPKLSQVFWPAVAQLARRHHYILVPELFQLAEHAVGADSLERQMSINLAKQYNRLARAEQQLSNQAKAVEYYTYALSYIPRNVDSLRGRARALEALGEDEKAAADRVEASRLAAASSSSQ